MIEIPAAEIAPGTTLEKVCFRVPETHRATWAVIAQQLRENGARQLYVKFGKPRRPRTTGHRSQNAHIHSHAQQIGEFTGDYKEDVIAEAKRRAVTKGYPTRTNSFGHIVPESETVIDTTEAALLIDELHMIASTVGVVLKEYDDGKA